jgi:hypothetical protein
MRASQTALSEVPGLRCWLTLPGMASADTPSTSTARAIVRRLLQLQDFAGRDELLAQVDGVEYEDGPLTMMRLRVSREFPASHDVRSPVPNHPVVVGDDGEVIGMMLLWLDDSGYIDCLEYGWVTDEIPTRLPDPSSVVTWKV